jgi:uncharacterized coiled-coil DUF342 family protein
MKHFRDSDDYNLSNEDMHESVVKHFQDESDDIEDSHSKSNEIYKLKKHIKELEHENKVLKTDNENFIEYIKREEAKEIDDRYN